MRADQRKVAGKHREFSEQFRENVRVGDASGQTYKCALYRPQRACDVVGPTEAEMPKIKGPFWEVLVFGRA